MKMTRIYLTLAATACWTVALTLPAYVKDFNSTYGVKPTSAIGKSTCGLCHVGKTKKLNPYGMDLDAAMKREKAKSLTGSVLKKVEGLDSDKDGVKNIDEIKKDKLPGDPKVK